MPYKELINEFWKQNGFMPFSPIDTTVYHYLLYQCGLRGWHNPFQLQTRDIEFHLSITRKQIGESRNRLKQRGLIDFSVGSRKETPTYLIKCLNLNMFPTETQIETQIETYQENPLKERSPIPPKEYIPKETDINNKYSSSRTREEIELERFDALLQEVVDGKHQQWEDQMRKKHGIESVLDYLPSFRNHVIANAKMDSVADVNGFKRYFNVAFRFFTKINPIELLGQYAANAKSEKFSKFCNWISKSAPNVAYGLVPMSEDEFENIFSLYDSGKVFNTIRDINEREDLIAKYFSLYRTLLKWMKNE